MLYEVTLPNLDDMAEDVAVPSDENSEQEDEVIEATVSYWFAEEGDNVEKGSDLVEVTTDKATFTVPTPESGTLMEKKVAEGDAIHEGEVLCVFELRD